MPGLLTNPMLNMGLGLLSASGPSLTPRNAWADGLQGGLLNIQRAQALEQQNKYREAQMNQMQQAEADRLMKRAQDAAQRERQQTWLSTLPPEQQQMLMAGGDPAIGEYIKTQIVPPKREIVKGADGFNYDAATGERVLPNVQAPPELTSAQREYEQAKTEGFKGSFVDYKKALAASGAVKIDMGGNDRISTSEAAAMQYPDGSQVPPGELWETARERGAQIISAEDKAAASKKGGMEATNQAALTEGEALMRDYQEKFEAYQEGWLPAGADRGVADESREALKAWYAKNILGTPGAEPSPVLYEKADKAIPDYAGIYDRSVFEKKLKGMKGTIRNKLGAGPEDSDAPKSSDVEALLNKYAP